MPGRPCRRAVAALRANPTHRVRVDQPPRGGAAQYRRHLRRGHRALVRHVACRCASRGMSADDLAGGNYAGMQSGLYRYWLADGKSAAMKPHHISAAAGALFLVVLTAAVAQTRLSAGQIATSLAGVSGDTRLDLTASQMRQAALDNIRNYPVIKPSSYRTVGSIADALHNPILLGYGFLVIGHTDSVGGREYNIGLSQRRAEAIVAALVDPFGVNPAVLQPVGLGEEQLRDPAHPTAAVNRRVQLVNVGKKFCFGRSGEQFQCQ